MDSKLQILLNIKMIFGEKHLTKDDCGEGKRFSQQLRSMTSNLGHSGNGITGSKLAQSNIHKFGGNSDSEQEVLEEKCLSESLEMNQGEYQGHVNVQDEWTRELEIAKKLSMSMMQMTTKVSDKSSMGAGVTVATLNSSMRKNLMKGVTLATAERENGSGRRYSKSKTTKKQTSKRQ